MKNQKSAPEPWMPAEYEIADVAAIQAIFRGDATPDQQKRALNWVIERAAGTYDMSYIPGGADGARNTDFAEGKRFVGNSIVKMLKINLGTLRGVERENT